MSRYTIQETHQMLREAAVYVDETGGWRVEYVEDLVEDEDGSFYAKVYMRDEDTNEQESFFIDEIDLGKPGVLLYRLELMNR